jgi:hypothetical protein
MDPLYLAKVVCNLSSTVFVGGFLAQDLIFVPMLRTLSPDVRLSLFDQLFERSKVIHMASAVISSFCHAYMYYITRDVLFLAAAIFAISPGPFSVLVVLPDVRKLKMMHNSIKGLDEEPEIFARWCVKSYFRTYILFGVSFGILLYKL